MGRRARGRAGQERSTIGRIAVALAAGGLLAALGCGSSSGATDAGGGDAGSDTDSGTDAASECVSRSGSRMSLLGRQGPGGEVDTTGLHDTELGTTCSYRELGGAWRCVPFTPTLYRNADCTDPVGVTYDDSLPRYHVIDDPGCAATDLQTVYSVAGELPSTGTFYLDSGAGCAQVQDPGGLVYELGDPVEPSVLATAEVVELGSGRIRVLRFDAGDGSRYCHSPYSGQRTFLDTELGTVCAPNYDVDDVVRCTPQGPFVTQVATDSDCSTSVDAADVTCSGDAAYAQRYVQADACPISLEVFALGDELPAAYGYPGGVCSELEGQYRSLGEVVAPSAFAALGEERVGEGRLQKTMLVTPDGVRLFDGQWYDTQLEAPCRARDLAGGTFCVPATLFTVPHYTDAACTVEQDLARRGDADCYGASAAHVLVGDSVHLLGDEVETVYTDSGGTCAPLPTDGERFYEIGAEATDFVELTPLPAP